MLRCLHCQRICLKREFYEEHQKVHLLQAELENSKSTKNTANTDELSLKISHVGTVGQSGEVMQTVETDPLAVGPEIDPLSSEEMETDSLNTASDPLATECQNLATDTSTIKPEPLETECQTTLTDTSTIKPEPLETECQTTLTDTSVIETDPLSTECEAMVTGSPIIESDPLTTEFEGMVTGRNEADPQSSESNLIKVIPVASAASTSDVPVSVPDDDDPDDPDFPSEVEIIDIDYAKTCETSDGNFECEQCKMCFQKHSLYIHHLFTHSLGQHCSSCNEVFSNVGEFEVHQIHHKRPNTPMQRLNKCKHCGACFAAHKTLQLHETNVHYNTNSLLLCIKCKSEFSNIVFFQYHILNHFGLFMHICREFCGMVFDDEMALKDHISAHKEKDNQQYLSHFVNVNQCSICAIYFQDKISLLSHSHIAHGGQKPYHCVKCSETYYKESLFNSHSCFN